MAFSVLSAAQGARLRNRIGDQIAGDEKLSDAVLDSIYTDAGLDLDCATVAALEELIGIYAMHVNIGGTTEVNEQRNQRVIELRKSLDYWLGFCSSRQGQSGFGISVGVMDLDLDTDYEDLDTD